MFLFVGNVGLQELGREALAYGKKLVEVEAIFLGHEFGVCVFSHIFELLIIEDYKAQKDACFVYGCLDVHSD